jgi:hypothetical protein
MLPQSYGFPFAVVLVLGGALASFAGYRLFRIVLPFIGFILGAMIASSTMGATNQVGMIAAAAIGGLVGALILVFAHFLAVGIVGAGVGAFMANLIWSQMRTSDLPWQLALVSAVAGAVAAMALKRHVIIVATAFVGSWMLIVGALTMAGNGAIVKAGSATEAWILYPVSPAPGQRWVTFAWVGLGLVGTAVQLVITAKKKK